jgi:hypothetical protein
MNIQEHTSEHICMALLLDLICYELCCGRLSPEMKYLLERHIEECPDCRNRLYGFLEILGKDRIIRNYG